MNNPNLSRGQCIKKDIYVAVVADDCQDNLLLVSLVLDTLGFEYYLAKDGKTALDLVNNKLPDLVLLDVRMPYLSGLEVNTLIKNNLLTSHIKTIAITGLAESKYVESVLNGGFDDHIIKPFMIEDLEVKIKRLLKANQN